MSSATWLQPSQAGLDAARVSIPVMGEYKATHFNGVSVGVHRERNGLQAIALFALPDVDVSAVLTPQGLKRATPLRHRTNHSRDVLTLWWLPPSKQGPSIVAYFTELFILGMISAKAVTYFSRGSRDPTIVKVCIAFSVLILWCKSSLNIKIMWETALFLPYRNNNRALPWPILTSIIISQIPVTLSQWYLCHQLWSISKKRLVPNAIAMAGTLWSTILFIIYAALRVKYPMPGGSQDRAQSWVPPWAFCTCITNIYLSLTCSVFLLRTRKEAVGDQLDYMLLRLASQSIATCLPPALISAIMAILEITTSTGQAWTFFTIIIPSVYALCILHTLNARHDILEEARSRATMKISSPMAPGPLNRTVPPGQRLTRPTAISLARLHSLKSESPSLSFPTNFLDVMTAPKRPSMNSAVELEDSAPFSTYSEDHHLRSRQDGQPTKWKNESQDQRAADAVGKKIQVQVLKKTQVWNGVK